MDEHSYLGELTTGMIYLAVGMRLERLAWRTRELPERLLGAMFLVIGASYLIYNAPIVFDLESLWTAFNFAGRVTYLPAPVLLAVFTRRVFRPDARWAGWLVYGSAILAVIGVAGSVSRGDWEGFSTSNPWFWLEWVGYTTPFAWAGAEALVQYGWARRRTRMGLCEPLVSNRLLLWGLFAVLQVCVWVLVLPQYAHYEQHSVFAAKWDISIAVFETSAIAVIWLVFFPPAIYRHWITPAETASVEGC